MSCPQFLYRLKTGVSLRGFCDLMGICADEWWSLLIFAIICIAIGYRLGLMKLNE